MRIPVCWLSYWYLEVGTWINILSKTQKEAPQGNKTPRYYWNWIFNGKFNSMMDTIRAFFPKSGHFFRFLEKAVETTPHLPSSATVSVAEYKSISLNKPKYPWKYLNELFWLYHCSEYAWSSYLFDRLLKMTPVLNKLGFWIWHRCIRKGHAEFRICLIVDPYGSI